MAVAQVGHVLCMNSIWFGMGLGGGSERPLPLTWESAENGLHFSELFLNKMSLAGLDP